MRSRARQLQADVGFLARRLLLGVGAYVLLTIAFVVVFAGGVFAWYVLLAVAVGIGIVLGVWALWRVLRRQPVRDRVGAAIPSGPARRGFDVVVNVCAAGIRSWLLAVRALARRERADVATYRGVPIPAAYRPLPDGTRAQVRTLAADPASWRDLAHLAVSPLCAAAAWAVLGVSVGAAVTALAWPLTDGPAPVPASPAVNPWSDTAAWPAWTWAILAAAVLYLLLVPVLLGAFARGTAWLGATLLGTGERERMRAELDEQRLRRRLAVEAAEVERRRIERDLHDGAQQRLVSLGLHLGLARRTLESNPTAGAALVAEAHEEAKLALEELRDLARGIHPAILADRGLDAALSALARRCAVPVEIRVELPGRPPTEVESAAYFVVAECLANTSRHAAATWATVTITSRGDAVIVEVSDDGLGGADPTRGTGLAGLADRVGGFGGRLDVDSPDGGPTTVTAVIPCAS